ncbi:MULTISPECIES: hypothetical protein [unclassified Pseudomonas]|uniref:hypothetical protein n=1 Tax=unclassified Pseudomonas TaxID=196821 RepID=UPI001473A54B|nr:MULTISPECIES: hypothetical protein [unclassified Pseudomonas]NMX92031.1 hypothetical protein [Pseudomonas sp. WS 5086]NMY46887.1 hypothetical protein [Pseudomonas sp. WS 5027]
MSKDDGGPAFARPFSKNGEYSDSQQNRSQEGMSLRDYFAAQALQGQMQREKDFGKTVREQGFSKYAAHIAETSYQLADAMLAARSA